MAEYNKDRIAKLQVEIHILQTLDKALAECSDEPDAIVYPLSPRHAAMFPDASFLLVWKGVAYAVNSSVAVNLTNRKEMTLEELPGDVQDVIDQGLDAIGA